MIHSGAAVAAGISQGRISSLNLDFKVTLQMNRTVVFFSTLNYLKCVNNVYLAFGFVSVIYDEI